MGGRMERIIAEAEGPGSVVRDPRSAKVPAIEDYQWLLSEVAKPWLALGASGAALTKLALELRKELTAERAHLVLEQIELRERAREKFSLAERMFFTRKGLEQATDERLAAYKASRFPSGMRVADLCCGLGGDLLALAGRGPAQGVDCDSVTALLASANAAALGLESQCAVIAGDAISTDIAGSLWHCD